jgi:hypothetical protein
MAALVREEMMLPFGNFGAPWNSLTPVEFWVGWERSKLEYSLEPAVKTQSDSQMQCNAVPGQKDEVGVLIWSVLLFLRGADQHASK